MELIQLDGGEDCGHTGVGFEEISKIFATQDAIFFGMEPFDQVYLYSVICEMNMEIYISPGRLLIVAIDDED